MSDFINAFPGYEYKWVDGINDKKQNMYRGVNLGFGGYVYYEAGMYSNVALLDVQSLHPHSIIAMNKFGKYTKRYEEILEARIAIKNHDYETAGKMLDGAFKRYLTSDEEADKLATALKLVLNSTYGYGSATFENPFVDSRDGNNIVACRGALFMKTLQDEVTKRGFTVAHIKTDSIKVPNATKEIVDFIMNFAKPYGYTFEFEGLYDRMCLINGSTYIAKYASEEQCMALHGFFPKDNKKAAKKGQMWTATAKQFQVPFVFKTLFSKEPIEFKDLCEAKEVKTAIYIDMNEDLPEGEHDLHFVGKVGNFCPIKDGCGGGVLVKEAKDKDGAIKYDSVTGTLKPDKTPYHWLEAESVKILEKENDIDKSYYRKLVDDAVAVISQYGDFERFVADEPYISPQEAVEGIDFPPDEDPPWYTDDELAAIKAAEEEGLPYYITSELARELDERQISDAFNKR